MRHILPQPTPLLAVYVEETSFSVLVDRLLEYDNAYRTKGAFTTYEVIGWLWEDDIEPFVSHAVMQTVGGLLLQGEQPAELDGKELVGYYAPGFSIDTLVKEENWRIDRKTNALLKWDEKTLLPYFPTASHKEQLRYFRENYKPEPSEVDRRLDEIERQLEEI